MRAFPCFVAFCCSIPLLAASAAQSRHGDAVLVDERGLSFLPEPADHLDFPKVSLAAPRTYRFRVSELPQAIYPSGFSLEVPQREDEFGVRREYAWSRCVLRASLMTPAGRVFHRRTYRLGRDRAGSHPGHRGRRAIHFMFTDYSVSGTTRLPRHLSYMLQIEVLQPSRRPSDMLTIEAFTIVHPKRPNQAMQRTASRAATDVLCVCHPRFGCVARFSGLAVADLVSR